MTIRYDESFKRTVAKASAELGDWRAAEQAGVSRGAVHYWRYKYGIPAKTPPHWKTLRRHLLEHGPSTSGQVKRALALTSAESCRLLWYHLRAGRLSRTLVSGRYVYSLRRSRGLPP